MTGCVNVRSDFASSGASCLKISAVRGHFESNETAPAPGPPLFGLCERRFDRRLEDGHLGMIDSLIAAPGDTSPVMSCGLHPDRGAPD